MASILKVDEIKERSVGSGITLGHALKNSSGTEIMSATGVFSSNIDGSTISNATLDSTVTIPASVGSSLVLLSSQDFTTVTAVNFTDVLNSEYRNYKLIGNIYNFPSGYTQLQFLTTGTSTFTNAVYSFAGKGKDDGGTDRYDYQSDTTFWHLDNDSVNHTVFDYTIYNPATIFKTFYTGTNISERTEGSLYITMYFGGSVNSNTEFSGFKLYPSTSTFSGKVSLYGIKQ